MVPEFENLTEEESTLLLKAPALVCVLIAGADGKIDSKEIEEAILISKIKQTRARKALIEYYREVGVHFHQQLTELIRALPQDAKERSNAVVEELEKLNPILKKLDKTFAVKLHASLKDDAKKIAEASGGVLGLMKIGYEESKFIDLKMIKDPSRWNRS